MILSLLGLMPGAFAQGLLWAVMAIGVYITYRILDIADLTAEGCFTLGAAVTCKLVTLGWGPFHINYRFFFSRSFSRSCYWFITY